MASIVISKFLHYTILFTISVKSFFQQNFNLIWTRIQHGLEPWMLLDALFLCKEGSVGLPLKNLMEPSFVPEKKPIKLTNYQGHFTIP
jgi:hypothetical protein